MSESHDLDLRLLDRALERNAATRQVFARDLKIAALIFLVFLFGIFFRFVDLSDQQLALETRLKEVGEAQSSLTQVKDGLGHIGDILQKHGTEVAEAVTQGRNTLRARIVSLNDDLNKLEQTIPINPVTPNAAGFSPVQAPVPPIKSVTPNASGFSPVQAPVPPVHQTAPTDLSSPSHDPPSPLHGLSDNQLGVLRQGRGDEYEALIRTIVNGNIVPRVFEELNQTKIERLDRPVDDAIASMTAPLAVKSPVLGSLGWTPASTRSTLDELSKTLHELHFKPPARDDWWRTIESKGRSFQEVSVDAQKAFSHLREGLAVPQESLENLDRTIAALAADATRNKADLDAKAKSLDKDYTEVQSLISGVARPLATLAMEPGTVVRYAPAILAAALTYFLIRYLALGRSQESLAQACRDLGYSDHAVDMYFDKSADLATVVSSMTILQWLPQQNLAILLFAAPGLLALVSAGRILASPSLKHQAPWFLYTLSFSLLALAYFLVTTPRFFQTRSSRAQS